MPKLLSLVVLLFLVSRIMAQTPEALVRDVQANVSGTSQLRKVLKKHAVSRDTHNNWSFDTLAFLGHKKTVECYRYAGSTGTNIVLKQVFLNVIVKGEQVGYITIDENYHDPAINKSVYNTLFKYVDSTYAAIALADYNTKHKTGFTWCDLFEDDWTRFRTDVGFSMSADLDSAGIPDLLTGGLSSEIKTCISLIKNKDHQVIVAWCQSFNPVRKAYGATCLYAMQQLGDSLSIEEKQLLKTIRQSNEKIDFSIGCLVERKKKINAILTKQRLDGIVWTVERVIAHH